MILTHVRSFPPAILQAEFRSSLLGVVIPGKEKAHKHKQFCPGTAWVRGGGVSRPGGQGSNVYVLCAEPKVHKHFRPGTRPGGLVTGATEKLFMCQMLMCPFWPLLSQRGASPYWCFWGRVCGRVQVGGGGRVSFGK